MDYIPPDGSEIQVDREIHSTTYSWKNGKKGWAVLPIAAFLTFWLCGWTVGGIMAGKELLFGKEVPIFARLFLLFWLCGWAFGECAVIFILCNIFRPAKPAKLIISPRSIEFHTGTKMYLPNRNSNDYNRNKRKNITDYFRNKVYTVGVNEMSNLSLDFAGDRQRLTFDVGVERVEIGESLTEPEREWLYEVLEKHISQY